MPRRFFTRLSRRFDLKDERPWYLKPFSYLLTHPVYFSTGRRAVSGGMAVGVFVGLLPILGQTAVAILAALMLRVNLPLAAVAVWVTNPVTFIPIFYFASRIGAAILNVPLETFPTEDTWWDWVLMHLRPLSYGSLLIATSAASITYLAVSTAWHVVTLNRYRQRHARNGASRKD